jgi:hypothetical protein
MEPWQTVSLDEVAEEFRDILSQIRGIEHGEEEA